MDNQRMRDELTQLVNETSELEREYARIGAMFPDEKMKQWLGEQQQILAKMRTEIVQYVRDLEQAGDSLS